MGSLLKMLMHSAWVGQLAQLGQTLPGPDIRCWKASVSVCLPGTSISPPSPRVNAALARPVRQIALLNTSPRKQRNDLQVDGRRAREKRKEWRGGRGWKRFNRRDVGGCASTRSDKSDIVILTRV